MKVRVLSLAILLILMVASHGAYSYPQIMRITVTPEWVAAGDHVLIQAEVSTNAIAVSANGIPLQKQSSGYSFGSNFGPPQTCIWSGSIVADAVLGEHDVLVIAEDQLLFVDTAYCSYVTQSVFGISCKSTADPIMSTACDNYLFKLWGRVTIIDSSNFWLDDGSGMRVTVSAPGYKGISTGSWASFYGVLDPSTNPPTLCLDEAGSFPNSPPPPPGW